jgi:NADH:ubiquinone oxidoreductase subunit 2 (subunit N)
VNISLYSFMRFETVFLFSFVVLVNFVFIFISSKDFYSKLLSYKNKFNTKNLFSTIPTLTKNLKDNDNVKQTFNNFYDSYYVFFRFTNIFLLYVISLQLVSNSYYYSYITLNYGYSLHLFNISYVYNQLILLLFIFTLLIFKVLLKQGSIKNFEYYIGLLFFFFCLYLYVNINNILLLVFLLEVQSTVIIYLISSSFNLFKNNSLDTYTRLNSLNSQPVWYFNSLIYQFWVSFIGAVLLVYGILTLFRFANFVEWLNLNIYFFFLTFSWYHLFSLQYLNIWLPLILGLFLKIGVVPFFFWKPEIYKNLTSTILFLYMTVYLFSLLFLFIVLFNNYFILIKEWFYFYLYIVSIITLIFISLYLYSIVEVRTFLAYSSLTHLSFVFLALSTNNYLNSSTALFYVFSYLYYMFFFFCIYFTLTRNTFWYLSDLQYVNSNIIVSSFLVFFVGLAGIPPFLGFFSKLSVIILLIFSGDYLSGTLCLFTGFFVAFFYLQNYRFYGYQKKYFNYRNKLVIVKNSTNLYYYLSFFIITNLLSIFFINDLFIFSNYVGFLI